MGRISADLLVQDTTVPRTALPDVLERVAEIGARHHLRVTNVFHAGDGNLHPNLSFDASDPAQLEHVALASREIMELCVAAGGTITGEHGVGVDKRKYLPLVFGPDDLGLMDAVRGAFDPSGRANPGKVIPSEDVRAWRAGVVVSGAIPTREAPPTPAPAASPTFHAPLPAAAAAVAEDVRRASADGARLQPRGAGTWWPDLAPGVRALDLAPLSDVARLEPANLVVTAGAGCRLDALDARLAAAGVWLALDPPGSAARTVGSVLATGGAGPLAARYGAPRDQLLGLTVVAGNGVPLRMGGRVVKNVAGFDVAKAVVGGHGAFGAIVEAHLRLHALPASDRTLAWAGSQRDVGDAAARILAAGAAPAALEVLDPPLAHAVLGSGGWALLVRDLGSTAAVDEELAVIACAVGRTLRLVDVAPETPWLAWRTTVGAWPVLLRIGADPAAWSDAAALARQHLGEGLGASVTVPRGTVRVGRDSATPGAVRALRADAALRGWPVVLERADASLRAAAGVWGELSAGALRLTEHLRRVYDQHGVFAVPLLP
jgi:D-lactate dehydrogenase (cytochrome)